MGIMAEICPPYGIGFQRNKVQILEQQEPKGVSPDQRGVTGGGAASRDHLYDIFQRISSLESSLTYLTAAVDDSRDKVSELVKDVNSAKAKLELLIPVAKSLKSGIWALFIALLGFGFSILGMWIKHKQGW